MNKYEYAQKVLEQQSKEQGCFPQILGIAIFVCLIGFFLSSCATKEKIVYRDRDINNYITNTIHDTLKIETTDSVYVEVKTIGDTVFQTKYKEKTLWRDHIVELHDTCWKEKAVTEYKETVKEVVKVPRIYRVSLYVCIALLFFSVYKLIKFIRNVIK